MLDIFLNPKSKIIAYIHISNEKAQEKSSQVEVVYQKSICSPKKSIWLASTSMNLEKITLKSKVL